MLDNQVVYKYETPYKVPFVINQCWTNGMVTLQYGAIKIGCNIRCIKTYTYNKNVKDVTPETNDL